MFRYRWDVLITVKQVQIAVTQKSRYFVALTSKTCFGLNVLRFFEMLIESKFLTQLISVRFFLFNTFGPVNKATLL